MYGQRSWNSWIRKVTLRPRAYSGGKVIVSKFGGSSVATAKDVQRIKQIVEEEPRVVVVSAPGKRFTHDDKVTDLLLALPNDPSLKDKILGRYKELCPDQDIKEIADLLDQRLNLRTSEEAHVDALKAFGEEACARMVAKELGVRYVDPFNLLEVTPDFGNAKILPLSEQLIQSRLPEPTVVVPGFYGYTTRDQIATFSRGGSDLTGAYIAAAIDAEVYENFTDQDGIFAADPSMVINSRKLDFITFDEIRDLAYSGFNIFHEDAMGPVGKKRVPVHVRNTKKYPEVGTYIVNDRLSDEKLPIVGVAYKGGLCSFDTAIFGLNDMVGVGSKMLQVFEDRKMSVEFITTGIDDMSVIFKQKELGEGPNAIGEITNELYSILGNESSVSFQEHLGSLVVAGKGLKGTKGIAGRVQVALAEAGVNLKFISQGPQERCIIYGINNADSRKAVNAVYNKFLR